MSSTDAVNLLLGLMGAERVNLAPAAVGLLRSAYSVSATGYDPAEGPFWKTGILERLHDRLPVFFDSDGDAALGQVLDAILDRLVEDRALIDITTAKPFTHIELAVDRERTRAVLTLTGSDGVPVWVEFSRHVDEESDSERAWAAEIEAKGRLRTVVIIGTGVFHAVADCLRDRPSDGS